MHGHVNGKRKVRLILLAKRFYVIIEHMMWSSQSAAPNDLLAATVVLLPAVSEVLFVSLLKNPQFNSQQAK